jgi:hypothetical protein
MSDFPGMALKSILASSVCINNCALVWFLSQAPWLHAIALRPRCTWPRMISTRPACTRWRATHQCRGAFRTFNHHSFARHSESMHWWMWYCPVLCDCSSVTLR